MEKLVLTLLLITAVVCYPQKWKWEGFKQESSGRDSASIGNGKTSLELLGGYNGNGFGTGLKASHKFGSGTSLSGSYYHSLNGGPSVNLGLSQKISPGFKVNFGVGHHFKQGPQVGVGLTWSGRKRRNTA